MKIILAEPQPNIRYGLKVLLTEQPGQSVVGEALGPAELLVQIEQTRPDLVLLSMQFPGLHADRLLQTIKQAYPGLQVILMSARAENREPALQAGADGFVCQAEPPEMLLKLLGEISIRC